jgi:hypothetical protein
MSDQIEPLNDSRAVRLLRAKVGELEAQVLAEAEAYGSVHRPVTLLAADIALIADLLADHIERTSRAE